MIQRAAFLSVLLMALGLAACSPQRVYHLTWNRFPPTPEDQEIKLYVTELNRPYVPIAHVQSFTARDRDTETVRGQLRDVKNRSRNLGADAVINVRQLKNRIRGYVVDDAVPFRAYEQGEYERYLVRGTAIKFVESPEEAAEILGVPLTEVPESALFPGLYGIPEIATEDPEDDLPMTVVPQGLGPSYP